VAELDITAFLRARLDERESVALAAQGTTEGRWEQDDPIRAHGRIIDDYGDFVTHDEGAPSQEQAQHIADNDPRFVLADVAAKRRLLAGHGPGRWVDESGGRWKDEPDNWDPPWQRCAGEEWTSYPCETVRLLALPYAGHPDYREEWKP